MSNVILFWTNADVYVCCEIRSHPQSAVIAIERKRSDLSRIGNTNDFRRVLSQRSEQIQRSGEPAQRRAGDPREDSRREPPRGRRHPQQPRRALRQAGQVQGGGASVQACARDQREGARQGASRCC